MSLCDNDEVSDSSELWRECLLDSGGLEEVMEDTQAAWLLLVLVSLEGRLLGRTVARMGPLLDDIVTFPLSTDN